MIRLTAAALACLLALAACGTPLEQCQRAATADLRMLEGERAERQRNLSRGYALEPPPGVGLGSGLWRVHAGGPVFLPGFCPHPVTGAPTPCVGFDNRWEPVPVPINRRLEARRIELLDQMIAEERDRAAPALAACRRQFPEG